LGAGRVSTRFQIVHACATLPRIVLLARDGDSTVLGTFFPSHSYVSRSPCKVLSVSRCPCKVLIGDWHGVLRTVYVMLARCIALVRDRSHWLGVDTIEVTLDEMLLSCVLLLEREANIVPYRSNGFG